MSWLARDGFNSPTTTAAIQTFSQGPLQQRKNGRNDCCTGVYVNGVNPMRDALVINAQDADDSKA